MTVVVLTRSEQSVATQVGLARGAYHERHVPLVHGERAQMLRARHVVGAWSEVAAARLLDRYWHPTMGEGFQGVPDLSTGIEVRHTDRVRGRLLVRGCDRTDRLYVLVTGPTDALDVIGWLPGGDCRRDEWRYDGNGREPVWMVPQHALRDLAELSRVIVPP